jgi:hypothetical protein
VSPLRTELYGEVLIAHYFLMPRSLRFKDIRVLPV